MDWGGEAVMTVYEEMALGGSVVTHPEDPGVVYLGGAGRKQLRHLFATRNYRHGAEIGVWEGQFAQTLCKAIPKLHLTCVDPWRPYAEYRERKNDLVRLNKAYEDTKTRLASYKVTILRMTSLEAAARISDGSLDFVYIDGNHEREHVLQDLAAWLPKVRAGGILSGHDFHINPKKPFIEVEQAVRAFTRQRGIAPVYVCAADKSPSWFWEVQ